jgi:glutaminyl-peptide cyclotransferase
MSFFSGALRGVGDLGVGLVGLLLAAGLTAVYGGPEPAVGGLATAFQAKEQQVPVLGLKVVKIFPHDPHAFTQGLEYYGGFLYESTGEMGQSSVRKIELETGKVLQKTELGSEYFGEGLTIFQGKIYQLTWLTKVGFVYDLRTLRSWANFTSTGKAGDWRTTRRI